MRLLTILMQANSQRIVEDRQNRRLCQLDFMATPKIRRTRALTFSEWYANVLRDLLNLLLFFLRSRSLNPRLFHRVNDAGGLGFD